MVLTSFNQKAYEEDLKNQYKEGIEEGINLGQKKLFSICFIPATLRRRLLS